MTQPTNDQIAGMASEVVDSEVLWSTFNQCIEMALEGEGFSALSADGGRSDLFLQVEDEVTRCLAQQWTQYLGTKGKPKGERVRMTCATCGGEGMTEQFREQLESTERTATRYFMRAVYERARTEDAGYRADLASQRAHLAGLALGGMLANPHLVDHSADDLARFATAHADALIERLAASREGA